MNINVAVPLNVSTYSAAINIERGFRGADDDQSAINLANFFTSCVTSRPHIKNPLLWSLDVMMTRSQLFHDGGSPTHGRHAVDLIVGCIVQSARRRLFACR